MLQSLWKTYMLHNTIFTMSLINCKAAWSQKSFIIKFCDQIGNLLNFAIITQKYRLMSQIRNNKTTTDLIILNSGGATKYGEQHLWLFMISWGWILKWYFIHIAILRHAVI